MRAARHARPALAPPPHGSVSQEQHRPSGPCPQAFERLKADFTYNLGLLRERDAELEQNDLDLAALRAEAENRRTSEHHLRAANEDLEARLTAELEKSALTQARVPVSAQAHATPALYFAIRRPFFSGGAGGRWRRRALRVAHVRSAARCSRALL